MQDQFKIERQPDKGQPLRRERGHRSQGRERKHRPAQQVDRQHRRRMTRLTPQQKVDGKRGNAEQAEHDDQRLTLGGSAQPQDQRSKSQCGQQRSQGIEMMIAARCMGQARQAEGDRDETQRHIDRKQPGPSGHRQDQRGNRRAERERNADHQGIQSNAAAHPRSRINHPDQCQVDAHDAAGSNALQGTRDGQFRQGAGASASQRCQRKKDQSAEKNATRPEQIAERSERQQGRHDRQLIGVDDPNRGGR